MLRLRSSILIQDSTPAGLARGTIRWTGHVLTKADILPYVRSELQGEPRKVVDRAIASNACVRTTVVSSDSEEYDPPILARHPGCEVSVNWSAQS